MEKICIKCGKNFTCQRSNANYCSKHCYNKRDRGFLFIRLNDNAWGNKLNLKPLQQYLLQSKFNRL